MRIAAAFDWNGVLAPANVRVDAWVTPPVYTGKPPIILSAANKDAGVARQRAVAGSGRQHADGALERRHASTSWSAAASPKSRPSEQAPKGTNERHFKIAGDGTAHVRAPAGQPQWKFAATPDRAPTISLAKDPERQARGSLQMSYKLEDDYGVTEARAAIRRARRRCGQGSEGRQGAGRQGWQGRRAAAAVRARRSLRWCCRMRAPATASARP